jgi:outer membrane protein OmpA-like peptidoglycan-associated protein
VSISRLLRPQKPMIAVEDHWIPLSDLMTGLMMVFMLVAIVFMVRVEASMDQVQLQRNLAEQARAEAEQKTQVMRDVAKQYYDVRSQLYDDLYHEFAADLPKWKATLDRDLSIRFDEPEVLFDTGKAVLKPQFISILTDFFPRYVKIISGSAYRDSIDEVRIEGHTSTIWSTQTSPEDAYFRNMELSQSRTRSALQFVLLLPQVADQKRWLTGHVTANGLSSSHPRFNAEGTENREGSQRVEFRVRTNAEARIGEILKAAR